MLVCLYALRGFTRPSYISWGGGGGGGLNNVLGAPPLPDLFHTTGQASSDLPILFSETRMLKARLPSIVRLRVHGIETIASSRALPSLHIF